MFLATRTIRKIKYLYLMESRYNKETGKSTPVIAKSYGRYDEAPEEVRKQYEDKTAKNLLEQKLEAELRAERLSNASALVNNQLSQAETAKSESYGNFNRLPLLHYGHLALKPIWDNDLKLMYKFNQIQRSHTAIRDWSLNALAFYLVCLKIMDPQSYLSAYHSKSDFLYCPWDNIVQDNFYRGLDYIYDYREDLISHAASSHLKSANREVKVAFFDCTNTFFETPYDDITWQIRRYTRKRKEELAKEGLTADSIQEYLDSDDFADELTKYLDIEKDQLLRMRGMSKEGRYAQPIVTVALAIDQTGFPVDCKVFAGNLSEIHTVEPMLESLKQKYKVKDIYFVADRGLNSAEKLDKIQQEDLGYVVAQKVSKQTAKVRSEMLSLDGYKNCQLNNAGDFVASESSEFNANAFRYKVCDFKKKYWIENPEKAKPDEPKKKQKTVNCKIIYTYSPERKARDLADLDNQIAKASKAVSDGILLGNQCGTGWRSLLQTKKEATSDKNEKEMFRVCGLKQEIIKEKRERAGYAAVVFSHPQGKNIKTLTDIEVLSTYHRLVRIEDCFRTMKSSFSIRPVHVRLKERITAHCYLCVLALMTMRALQEKLEAAGKPMSAEQISRALFDAYVIPQPLLDGTVQSFMNVGSSGVFSRAEFTGKGKSIADENEIEDSKEVWENYRDHRIQNPFEFDQILETVGLKKLRLYSSVKEFKSNMKILSVRADKFLSPHQANYLKEAVRN